MASGQEGSLVMQPHRARRKARDWHHLASHMLLRRQHSNRARDRAGLNEQREAGAAAGSSPEPSPGQSGFSMQGQPPSITGNSFQPGFREGRPRHAGGHSRCRRQTEGCPACQGSGLLSRQPQRPPCRRCSSCTPSCWWCSLRQLHGQKAGVSGPQAVALDVQVGTALLSDFSNARTRFSEADHTWHTAAASPFRPSSHALHSIPLQFSLSVHP